ncbi:accessory gene regulator B family protein [Paenibacillus polymyxa]|uniref:accessory gene regulator B family protein n=1 Tax=Paenibacillus polymyxa TaxID=1406 RepID=UPI00307ED612
MNMINQLADKWSISAKRKYPDELPSQQIVRYTIKFIISNTIPIFIVLIASMLLGITKEAILALIGFSSVRMFSGGFHFKSAEMCIVFSSLVIILIASCGNYFDNYSFAMYLASIILVMLYAPSKIEQQTRVKPKNFKWFKIISLILVTLIYTINIPVLNLAALVQSLLLIRLRGGEKV